MISKELVLDEINRLEHILKIYERRKDNFHIEITKTNIEVQKIILQDLERLEELEKYESINGQLDAFNKLHK